MNEIMVNDVLHLAYGDQYREMTADELNAVYNDNNSDIWGIADEQHHIMITVHWTNVKTALFFLTNIKTAARGIHMMYRRTMPGYKRLNQITTQIAGRIAQGFCYRYYAGETSQVGMTIVMKYEKCFYIVSYYAREKDGIASHKEFQKVLNTFRFSPKA